LRNPEERGAATEASVRESILKLKQRNACIHINYHNTYPKVSLLNEPVAIGNVYAHLFQLIYTADGRQTVKSHSYADVICRRLEIVELTQ